MSINESEECVKMQALLEKAHITKLMAKSPVVEHYHYESKISHISSMIDDLSYEKDRCKKAKKILGFMSTFHLCSKYYSDINKIVQSCSIYSP